MPIYNEFSKLTGVILGISPKIFMQRELPSEMDAGLSWIEKLSNRILHTIFNKKPLPNSISKRYESELDELYKVLIAHGVKVFRPDAIEPLPEEADGLIQMFARDPAMTVGKHFVFGNLQIPMRKKELRGYKSLIPLIKEYGLGVSAIDPNTGAFLEGGDVLVDYPNVFVGINTNKNSLPKSEN